MASSVALALGACNCDSDSDDAETNDDGGGAHGAASGSGGTGATGGTAAGGVAGSGGGNAGDVNGGTSSPGGEGGASGGQPGGADSGASGESGAGAEGGTTGTGGSAGLGGNAGQGASGGRGGFAGSGGTSGGGGAGKAGSGSGIGGAGGTGGMQVGGAGGNAGTASGGAGVGGIGGISGAGASGAGASGAGASGGGAGGAGGKGADACAPGAPERAAAEGALEFLRQQMDRYHSRFYVYEDVSAAGNHFNALGKLPNGAAAVTVNGSYAEGVDRGATVIQCEFVDVPGQSNWGGFYFMKGVLQGGASAPSLNFGEIPNAGIDLSGATRLSFRARGRGRVEFFVAGVGHGSPAQPYPDSSQRVPAQGTPSRVTLTDTWQTYTIDLSGKNMSYVLGGFGWVADDTINPGGAVFFLDDIFYEFAGQELTRRLNQPRFIQSFVPLPVQSDPHDANTTDDFDTVFRNTAFSYDNALALLAFLADGSADSVRRAKLIGDAFVYAANHDRTFVDGRIRSAYSAGDISLPPGWAPNGKIGTTPIPGYYYEADQRFYEILQDNVDVGNNAWTMIALLALHRQTGESGYLEAARKIGIFIRDFRVDAGAYQGFLGGYDNPESATPPRRPWASSEHNLDIYAAFRAMFDITGESEWLDGANHAAAFIETMWADECYFTGTSNPDVRNESPNQLPLDVQAWSILARAETLSLHPDLLGCPEARHATTDAGFSGFDFNNDKDGVWPEGTGQMAVAYSAAGAFDRAATVRATLRALQAQTPFGDTQGIAAATHDNLTTGFGFEYFRRLHVGATAWNVFAQLAWNPYYQSRACPELP